MKIYIKAGSDDYSEMSREELYKIAKKQHLISNSSDKWTYDRDLLQYAIMYNVKLNQLRMREGKRLLKPDELNSLFNGDVRTFKNLFKEFWPKEAKKNPTVYFEDDYKMEGPDSGAGYVVDSAAGKYQDEMTGRIDYFDIFGRYIASEEPWEI